MIMKTEKQLTMNQHQQQQQKTFDYYEDNKTTSASVAAAAALAASRSVPATRRNSNDERSRNLFETSFNQYDTPIDFLMKPPPRSFSIDVGSMPKDPTYTSFFDNNDHHDPSNPSVPTYRHQNYLRSRFDNNINRSSASSSVLNNNTTDYGLFTSRSDMNLESNPRKSSARSTESLRSKSWAQFLETKSLAHNQQPQQQQQQQQYYTSTPGPLDVAHTPDIQSAFYAQPARRFSHGWVPPAATRSNFMDNLNKNNSTTTLSTKNNQPTPSYSYSDIHMASALNSFRQYNATPEPCQHFRQYGYCNLKEQCPYSHVLSHSIHEPQPPSLRYSNSTSTCNSNIPIDSSLYDPIAKQDQRRPSADSEMNKFIGLQLDEFQGKLYELCKDQHGCRFLQIKLEESNENVNTIYNEIHPYFVDLMTDPFGNYLCQKLLERCDDEQKSNILQVITPDFLRICLSMHGTRAVQRLIEFLSTKKQIQAVIAALAPNVVALIKDLNGNHVIQKCLYKLSPENNQFIYDTVSEYCIQVASHKHGCCVYQRCIDHAAPSQKAQLVNVITKNALPLVQDPFGNYVVQYVLDLGDAKYSDNLIRRFVDHIRELSVQKFSSNVIEKCICVAERDTKRLLIAGIIQHPSMEKFLKDSYANYVIQTCLDFAEEDQRAQFIDCIRPLLPSIRNTPYGKRIYTKIHNTSRQVRPQQRMTGSITTTSLITGINALNLASNTGNNSSNSNSDNPLHI